jgi:hypothetical protein
MKNTILIVCLALVTGIFYACQKSADASSPTLKVKLTDNPVNAQQVNIDLKEVRVNYKGDSTNGGWTTLTTTAGVYNLLDFQNGVDTTIATGAIPGGQVKEIRFVLGNNNTIMVDSVIYPLTIPSGSESGLKIKVGKNMRGSLDSLVVDFDAALSIHQTGTGKYMLKPVLKIK